MDSHMPIWATVLIAVISAVGGGFGKVLLDFFTKKNEIDQSNLENRHKISMDTNLQALQIYQDLVKEFKAETKELGDELEKLKAEHINCEKENAKLNAKLEILEARIKDLEARLQKV